MVRRFTRGRRAVMTGRTAAGHFIVVNPCCRRPALGTMAGVTGIGALNMLSALALRRGAIVTTGAGAIHMCMINRNGWCPAGFNMAGITH